MLLSQLRERASPADKTREPMVSDKVRNGYVEANGKPKLLASPLRTPSLPCLEPQSSAASVDFGAHIGLDIGGTLTKMAFLDSPGQELGRRMREFLTSRTKYGSSGERDSQLSVDVEGGTLHFVLFSSDELHHTVDLISSNRLQENIRNVYTAGGGAHKLAPLFKKELGVELVPADELETVVRGISWLVEHVEGEILLVEDGKHVPLVVRRDRHMQTMVSIPPRHSVEEPTWRPLFPMLVVNIGTGVSILKATSACQFERVSGTALGGGTYWGLCQLLTGCCDFEEAARLAAEGDSSAVNLEVRDIYGGDYELPSGQTLPGNLTASFFAKGDKKAGSGAVLHALATMIAQNVCQIALLNARIHETPHIVFTGNFLRQNPVAMHAISDNFKRVAGAMNCGGLQPQAFFLRHEGYFGSLGSLLLSWQTSLPADES